VIRCANRYASYRRDFARARGGFGALGSSRMVVGGEGSACGWKYEPDARTSGFRVMSVGSSGLHF